MNILLAGPGTGKTTNIKNIIEAHGDGTKFLILSFTKATIKDLINNLNQQGITEKNCMTLHKFAVKYNHDYSRHVLMQVETDLLKKLALKFNINYVQLCDFLKCTTFDQMIERFVEYAKANPLYLQEKLADYDSLIVDEYQDFNPSEQKLIDILIEKINNSYVLGDDDQCIYDFKDASADKIISFHNDNNNKQIPHEHKCHRCPDKVVKHATLLIKNNKKRVDKKWEPTGKDGEVIYNQLKNFEDIADSIISEIENKGLKDSDVLILTPFKFAAIPLIKKLEDKKIEFSNYLSEKIPEDIITKSWEIRMMFGNFKYLNLLFFGYHNQTSRKKYYALLKKHFEQGINYEELFELLKSKIPERLKSDNLTLENLLNEPYYQEIFELYQQTKDEDPDVKIESIFKEIEEQIEKNIKIMSIHKSKGLGATNVFIIGLNEGIIPNKKLGSDSIESQRRVLFVGITRTKKMLYLYSNTDIQGALVNKVNKEDFKYNYREKILKGKASSFINEMQIL